MESYEDIHSSIPRGLAEIISSAISNIYIFFFPWEIDEDSSNSKDWQAL